MREGKMVEEEEEEEEEEVEGIDVLCWHLKLRKKILSLSCGIGMAAMFGAKAMGLKHIPWS